MANGVGIIVDSSDAERVMTEMAVNRAKLAPEIARLTLNAGRDIQRTARQLAKSRSMPGLAKSIWTRTRHYGTDNSGTEVTIEAKSPFGYIREFGAGRSGPHPFMLPALEQHLPGWEQALVDAANRVL